MKIWNDIFLTRLVDDGKETQGFLSVFDGGTPFTMFTLELPWKDNKQNISCIPVGSYAYEKWYSPTFNTTVIRLLHVKGRENILIHPANYVSQLRGCIAPGLMRADINGDGAIDVGKSKAALYKLLSIVPETGFIHIGNI